MRKQQEEEHMLKRAVRASGSMAKPAATVATGRARHLASSAGTAPAAQLEDELRAWLAATRADLVQLASNNWANGFTKRYGRVIARAEKDSGRIVRDVLALSGSRRPGVETLLNYVAAMSIEVDGEPIFLPSFSDNCLQDALSASGLYLSPFRGIYYCWQLGEIAVLLEQGRARRIDFRNPHRRASKRLDKVWKELEEDFRKQRSSGQYSKYYRELEQNCRQNDPLAGILSRQVAAIKDAFRFGIDRKSGWCRGLLPYPCQHSTHFYLSGVRFYWNPYYESQGVPFGAQGDRFSVQSTSSGLSIPTERYGMLLPEEDDPDAQQDLLNLIPPGSLRLHLEPSSPPSDDLPALKYFERWSRLVTAKAYSVFADIRELLDCEYEAMHAGTRARTEWTRLAQATYMEAVSKNPMRTFYFDAGLLAAAQMAAAEPDGYPPVQYVTSQHSRPRNASAKRLLDETLALCGNGLRMYCLRDGRDYPASWEEFTLVPIVPDGPVPGNTPRLDEVTGYLWSIRDPTAKKITAGLEGRTRTLARYRAVGEVKKHAKVAGTVAAVGTASGIVASIALGVSYALPVDALLSVASYGMIWASEFRKASNVTQQIRRDLLAVPSDTRNFIHVQGAANFP